MLNYGLMSSSSNSAMTAGILATSRPNYQVRRKVPIVGDVFPTITTNRKRFPNSFGRESPATQIPNPTLSVQSAIMRPFDLCFTAHDIPGMCLLNSSMSSSQGIQNQALMLGYGLIFSPMDIACIVSKVP